VKEFPLPCLNPQRYRALMSTKKCQREVVIFRTCQLMNHVIKFLWGSFIWDEPSLYPSQLLYVCSSCLPFIPRELCISYIVFCWEKRQHFRILQGPTTSDYLRELPLVSGDVNRIARPRYAGATLGLVACHRPALPGWAARYRWPFSRGWWAWNRSMGWDKVRTVWDK